jgi:hypothetical protein
MICCMLCRRKAHGPCPRCQKPLCKAHLYPPGDLTPDEYCMAPLTQTTEPTKEVSE